MTALRLSVAAACLAGLLSACASDSPVRAVYVPVISSESSMVSQLSRDVQVSFSDGTGYTLPSDSRWRRIGALVQGDVYKHQGAPFMVGKRGGSEAYLVATSGKLVGFYLPGGNLFMPLGKPVVLPFSQRQ